MKRQMPRFLIVFLLLALSGFIIVVCTITSLEKLTGQVISTFYQIQNSIHSAFISLHPLTSFPGNMWQLDLNHCAQFGQEPTAEEVNEERDLLNSIAWPGPLVQGLPVELSSDPSKSYFVIQGPEEQHIGGQLEVNVHVQNFLGLPKNHGGDFLIARLHSPELGASVTGQVQDHQNGNYTVLFPLLWAGVVWVEITMVHPSEAVVVLKRLQEEQPDRVFFKSLFRSGSVSETTECNLCLPLNHQPLCNYTDPETGEPWYCYKPKMLGCDTRINHYKGGYKKNLITEYEAKFFKSNVNIKVPIHASGIGNVTVLPADKGLANLKQYNKTSGFYFHNVWRPLLGAVFQQFNDSSAITRCLKGKSIYMFGDSTVRQWFEYLTASVPAMKGINFHSIKKTGPFMAVDSKNNILVSYRCHGPPLSFTLVPSSDLRYVANEIDRIRGGPDTVVIVSVWAHFSPFPMEVYIRRLRHIRRAVVRLLNREPATLVVIRSANLRKLDPEISLFYSDWFSLQINSVLCAMFKGLNVELLDAWQMTLAHHLPHDIHPAPPIIKNMIDLILSNICTAGKKRKS